MIGEPRMTTPALPDDLDGHLDRVLILELLAQVRREQAELRHQVSMLAGALAGAAEQHHHIDVSELADLYGDEIL